MSYKTVSQAAYTSKRDLQIAAAGLPWLLLCYLAAISRGIAMIPLRLRTKWTKQSGPSTISYYKPTFSLRHMGLAPAG